MSNRRQMSCAGRHGLAGVAAALGVPAVITEEDPGRNGATDARILEALGADTPVFTKPVFGLAGCPDILAAVRATGRSTAVLAGFETDVCVAQSAVGLVDLGFRVGGARRRDVLAR